jgi:hypothetical protein
MFGLLAGFGRRRRGIHRLEKKIERLQARPDTPQRAHQIKRLQERLDRKKSRWGTPNATTAAATSGAAGVPPKLAVSTTPAAVAATAALPPVMPPYPAGTIPPANWNEAGYLKKHPDVARGVNGGTIPSGLWHYMVSGKKEGRELSGLNGFDLSTGSLLLGVGLGAAAFYAWKRFSR